MSQETHRFRLWTTTKQIIRTLTNDEQRNKMEYVLYQKPMTDKELQVLHTFALYLREKQSIEAHVQYKLVDVIDSFVKLVE